MLIKKTDDKASDLAILQSLLKHPAANAETRKKIEQEIRNVASGAKGEADTAYEIDFHYGPSNNWAVIHDLRIEHKGRVAQIDHLLVNRFFDVWVFESKRFSEGIAINEYGECSMFWNGKPTGIASPHEQNAKHVAVLKAVCADGAVTLPRRLGIPIKPAFKSLVVVSRNARITRPKAKGWWNEGIVKADQVKARIEKALNDENVLLLAKVVSSDTLESFARGLAALHVPASPDWHARFGLARETSAPVAHTVAAVAPPLPVAPLRAPRQAGAVCHACGVPVEEKVVAFCLRFNKDRFGGKVYCRDCQAHIPRLA